MNTKARQLLLAATTILLLGGAGTLAALPVVAVDYSISIAPSSIPVPETGNLIVGMNKVQISTNFSGGDTSVDQLVVQLISTGAFNAADIASIRVWYEPPGGNGLFDNGTSIDDLNALSGGPYTFSGGTATIALNTTTTFIGASAQARFYVGVELKSTAATSGVTIGVQVTSLRQTGKTALPVAGHGIQKPLDTYRVALTANNIVAPSDQKQGESAAVLRLFFDPDDPDNSAAVLLESIKLHATGTPRSDLDLNSGGVVLYEDTNGNSNYDSGVDAQIASATLGAVTPAYATITPATPVLVPPAGKRFFIIVNISLVATIGDVIQLQVDNPSTDITFSDAYADEVVGADYASVPAGRAYVQKGYLLGVSAVPSPNTPAITIIKQDLPQNPTVTSIVPGNNATNVDRTTKVVVIFSKPMKASTINTTNITLSIGATPVACSVVLEADTVTATLTPSSILEWGTTYTATVKGDGLSGVQDNIDNLWMSANKVWSFSTPPAVPPVVLATSPANAAIEVPRDTLVKATFSKDMNGPSVEANFKLWDGASYVSGTASYDGITRTVTFTPSTRPFPTWGTQYTASIDTGAYDMDGLLLQSKYSWVFTTTAAVYPIVNATSPVNAAIEVPRDTTVTATFSKDMDGPSVQANFKLHDGTSYVSGAVSYDIPTRTATFTPATLPFPTWGTKYTASIDTGAFDTENLHLQGKYSWTFTTTAAVYPIVVSRNPAHGAIEVDPTGNLTATFSKDMEGSTFNTGTCLLFRDLNGNNLYDAGDILIARSASLTSPRVVTIVPAAPLDWNTVYTVNITSGVKDLDGLYMQNISYWFFTTMVLRTPAVLGFSPAANAVAVPRSTSITVAFSKDLDPLSIEGTVAVPSTTFLLKDSNNNPVAGTVSYDSASFTATFDPEVDLAFGTYNVMIVGGASGVKDRSTPAQGLAADVSWSFTTRPSLTEPVAANNRIVPGSAAPVMIFIPQPTANPADRVTVQVFTVTGKKVATLINNQPYNSFEASLPLLWYGKNGLGENLGPGLYFIQIRAPNYKRSLKVMIVR